MLSPQTAMVVLTIALIACVLLANGSLSCPAFKITPFSLLKSGEMDSFSGLAKPLTNYQPPVMDAMLPSLFCMVLNAPMVAL